MPPTASNGSGGIKMQSMLDITYRYTDAYNYFQLTVCKKSFYINGAIFLQAGFLLGTL